MTTRWLVMLESRGDDHTARRLLARTGDAAVFATGREELTSGPREAGQAVLDPQTVLDGVTLRGIDEQALRLMATWPEPQGYRFRGVPIAELFTHHSGVFAQPLRTLTLMRTLLQREQIDGVMAPEPLLSVVRSLVGDQTYRWQELQRQATHSAVERVRRLLASARRQVQFAGLNGMVLEHVLGEHRTTSPAGHTAIPHVDVVFVASYQHHVTVMTPVIAALHARGMESLVVAVYENARRELSRRAVSFRCLGDVWESRDREALRDEVRRLRALGDLVSRGEVPQWQQAEAAAAATLVRRGLVDRYIKHRFPRAVAKALMFDRILERCQAAVVVVGDDLSEDGRLAVQLAEHRGIHTVHLQHGEYGDPASYSWMCAGHFFAWNDAMRQRLVDGGYPPERVRVVGNPAFDRALAYNPEYVASERARWGIGAAERVAVWAPPYFQQHAGRWTGRAGDEASTELAELMQALVDTGWDRLVVKLHPLDDGRALRKLLTRRSPLAPVTLRDTDIFDVLSVADVVLTWNSGVITEAALMGKPLVGLNLYGMPELIPCASLGIALVARNPAELRVALRTVAASGRELEALRSRQRAYVAQQFGSGLGRASERAAELLSTLATRQAPREKGETQCL